MGKAHGQVRGCFMDRLVAVAFAEYCVRSRSTKPELQMARTKKKIVRREWTQGRRATTQDDGES